MRDTSDFDIGDVARVEVELKNVDAVLADPTSLQVKVVKPDGTSETTDYVGPAPGSTELQRVSAGLYYINVVIDQSGTWHGKFWATGNNVASAEEFEFRVKRPTVT